MMKLLLFLFIGLSFTQCVYQEEELKMNINGKEFSLEMDQEKAEQLVLLPLKCVEKEYPNKLGQVLNDSTELLSPKALHPTFYGCFDWHSSVHGYWLMVKMVKEYPSLNSKERILGKLRRGLTAENVQTEMKFFETALNGSFERTYGWAWLLRLQLELNTWEDNKEAKMWAENLQPLSNMIIAKYQEFLPKLKYPIRSGEHTNSAFGMSLAYDYAVAMYDFDLKDLIDSTARKFYLEDRKSPISWEPSGYDFLSPSLCEANLMCKILPQDEFMEWFEAFLPNVMSTNFSLKVAEVGDRTDGKLVHLDGLNFSRAWALYSISRKYPRYAHLRNLADEHVAHSLPSIIDGNYMGEHWLASFAAYALLERKKVKKVAPVE